MAVLATFDPGNSSYGRSADALFSGLNEAQSLMERKQAMALRQQQADQQKAEFMAKLPLIAAQTTLTQANAAAAVKNATERTNFETKAAAESVAANKEFMDAQQFTVGGAAVDQDGDPTGLGTVDTQATWEARANKLAGLRAKYGYMANLPGGYGAFYDTLTKSWAQAMENTHINLKADEALAIANTRADAAKFGANTRLEGTKYTADTRAANADVYTRSRERIAQINSDTKLTVQERAGQIAAAKQAATIESLSNYIQEEGQRAAEAAAQGDEILKKRHLANASAAHDDIARLTTHPGVEPSAPATSAPPLAKTPTEDIATSAAQRAVDESASANQAAPEAAVPTAVAPTKVPKDAVSVDIGGKTYPIYKDKNGKRAYKVDGHFVPLDTE